MNGIQKKKGRLINVSPTFQISGVGMYEILSLCFEQTAIIIASDRLNVEQNVTTADFGGNSHKFSGPISMKKRLVKKQSILWESSTPGCSKPDYANSGPRISKNIDFCFVTFW